MFSPPFTVASFNIIFLAFGRRNVPRSAGGQEVMVATDLERCRCAVQIVTSQRGRLSELLTEKKTVLKVFDAKEVEERYE